MSWNIFIATKIQFFWLLVPIFIRIFISYCANYYLMFTTIRPFHLHSSVQWFRGVLKYTIHYIMFYLKFNLNVTKTHCFNKSQSGKSVTQSVCVFLVFSNTVLFTSTPDSVNFCISGNRANEKSTTIYGHVCTARVGLTSRAPSVRGSKSQ